MSNKSTGNGIRVLLLITCCLLSSNILSDQEVYDRETGKRYEIKYAGDGFYEFYDHTNQAYKYYRSDNTVEEGGDREIRVYDKEENVYKTYEVEEI